MMNDYKANRLTKPGVPVAVPLASRHPGRTSGQGAASGNLSSATFLTSLGSEKVERIESPTNGSGRKRITRSQLLAIRSQLSERDIAILRSLKAWRLQRIEHLRRLHFQNHTTTATALRVARRVLARLENHRLVRRLKRRVGGVRAGSAGSIFCLAPLGHRLLDGSNNYWREPSPQFTNHLLAITELGSAAIESAAAEELEITEVATEPRSWRTYRTGLHEKQIKPDLLLRLASANYYSSWFIEVDLGTESMPRLSRKCQAYLDHYDHLQSSGEQDQDSYYPSVLWVMNHESRVKPLQKIIRQLNSEVGLFKVTTDDRAVEQIMDHVR